MAAGTQLRRTAASSVSGAAGIRRRSRTLEALPADAGAAVAQRAGRLHDTQQSMDLRGSKSNQHSGAFDKVVFELMVALGSQEARSGLSQLAKKLADVRASGESRPGRVACRQRPRRPGWVLKAIIHVLADREEPMRAKDIHAAVEALLGEPVSWSSIKGALADNASGSARRFVRIARGRYVLA
jgi:hypothetical protein